MKSGNIFRFICVVAAAVLVTLLPAGVVRAAGQSGPGGATGTVGTYGAATAEPAPAPRGGGGSRAGTTARGGGPGPGIRAASLEGPAVNLDATIYDLRLPPELIGRLDVDALTKAAASAEAFEKALAELGTAKPLYRAAQAVRLSGDTIRITSSTPYITSSTTGAGRGGFGPGGGAAGGRGAAAAGAGETVNSISYASTGAAFTISGELEEVPLRINLTLSIEVSTLTESPAELTATLRAPAMRSLNLARNGFVELRQPFVILSIDGASADAGGKAVAYIARVSLSQPAAAAPAAGVKPEAVPAPTRTRVGG